MWPIRGFEYCTAVFGASVVAEPDIVTLVRQIETETVFVAVDHPVVCRTEVSVLEEHHLLLL